MTPSSKPLTSSQDDKKRKPRAPTDYSSVPIPDSTMKPYKSWDAKERKAYILQLIMKAGSSSRLSRTELARQFTISIARISQDIKVLDGWVAQSVDADKVHSWVLTTFQKAHKKLLEEGREKEAFYLALDFANYLMKLGIVHKAPDELNITGGLEIVFQTVKAEGGEAHD